MRTVVAIIVKDGQILSVGSNEHKGECGREGYPSGEGYELCEWCNYGNHAEANAVRGRTFPKGAKVLLFGHTYACEPCKEAVRKSGIKELTICEF